MKRTILSMLAGTLVVLAACSAPTPGRDTAPRGDTTPSAGVPLPGGRVDQATITRLENEARALARVEGCAEGAQCKSAPVGAKACGGPRSWLPYCPLTTDERALLAKLDELKRAEEAYNRENQVVSTCEYIMEPRLESVGGRCAAARP